MSKEALLKLLEPYNQQHLLHFWDDLTQHERDVLSKELHSVDFQRVNELATQALHDLKNGAVNKVRTEITLCVL